MTWKIQGFWNDLQYLTLKVKALWSFNTWYIISPTTQYNIPEGLNLQKWISVIPLCNDEHQ